MLITFIIVAIIIIAFVFAGSSKKKPTESQMLSHQKNSVTEWFDVDICNIFKYNPVFKSKETTQENKEVEYYTLNLSKKELGVFDLVKIIKVSDSEYNLVFTGISRQCPNSLLMFLNFVADKYGLDSAGLGRLTQEETAKWEAGMFVSRMWFNNGILFDTGLSDNLAELTIFSPTKITE